MQTKSFGLEILQNKNLDFAKQAINCSFLSLRTINVTTHSFNKALLLPYPQVSLYNISSAELLKSWYKLR